MGHWPLDRIIKRHLKVSMFFYYKKKKQSTVPTVEINELFFIELENWQLTWTEDVSNVQPCKWENLVINNTTHFFFIWVFFHNHSRITGLQGKWEGISLTPHYHFHGLHKHLDISLAITAESLSLYIGSSRTRTRNLWFPSASS